MDDTTLLLKLDLQFFAKDGPGGEKTEPATSICIATATDRYLIEAALRRCGIENLFDAIFTCSEVGHGKDEPVIFRRAMEHFGAQRGSTVVFEDAIHAIETAKKDGFTVAAVFDESEKRQDEVRALADCYITSFEQLEQFWAMTAAD